MFSRICKAAAAALLLLPASQVAWAQIPYNRDLEKIAVWPERPGSDAQRVSAVWTYSVEPASAPLNLSTDVELEINGVPVALRHVDIQVDGGSGFCEAGPPCSGGCGSSTLDGGAVAMLCYKDGVCDAEFCDCDCGYWITSEFEGVELMAGDEITVILYPAPGALPEVEPGDNVMTTPYHGRPIGWDRAIEGVTLVEVSPGFFDIHVEGAAGWETQPGYGNLDFVVEARRNGITLAAQNVPAELEGIFDQGCFQLGCGSDCGTYNGVERNCSPYLWWDCACFAGWISVFPGVQLEPGDEIMVILYPLPGSLPEIPRPNDNDSYIVFLSGSSVEGEGTTQPVVRLWQSRPNPFHASTAIEFELAAGGPAQVGIYDASGRLVRRVLERSLASGRWTVTWDGRTEDGAPAAAGTYFCNLKTPEGTETRKVVLQR